MLISHLCSYHCWGRRRGRRREPRRTKPGRGPWRPVGGWEPSGAAVVSLLASLSQYTAWQRESSVGDNNISIKLILIISFFCSFHQRNLQKYPWEENQWLKWALNNKQVCYQWREENIIKDNNENWIDFALIWNTK